MRRPEIRKVHPVLLLLCFTFQRVPGKTCVCDVSKATGAYCVQIDKNNQNDWLELKKMLHVNLRMWSNMSGAWRCLVLSRFTHHAQFLLIPSSWLGSHCHYSLRATWCNSALSEQQVQRELCQHEHITQTLKLQMQRRREMRVGRVEQKYVEMCSDGDVCLLHRKKYNLFFFCCSWCWLFWETLRMSKRCLFQAGCVHARIMFRSLYLEMCKQWMGGFWSKGRNFAHVNVASEAPPTVRCWGPTGACLVFIAFQTRWRSSKASVLAEDWKHGTKYPLFFFLPH